MVVSKQRIPAQVLSGDQECVVCTETIGVALFPGASITKSCEHPPATCLECVAMSIQSDLSNKLWNEIRCPECGELLEYDDVQRYADPETRERYGPSCSVRLGCRPEMADSGNRYQNLSFRYALSEADNFRWCTAGCQFGQVHDSGYEQPIMTCLLCGHRSCYKHSVAWHKNLTCDEYDALEADPENFRSRYELANEMAQQLAETRRVQEDADRVYAQSLLAEEQREADRARREREERERQLREAEERRVREEERRRADEMRQSLARKKREEEQSQRIVAMTSKPCPGCGWSIEKNDGW